MFSCIVCLNFAGARSSLYDHYLSSVACSQISQVLKVIFSFHAEEFEKYCDDIANTAAWGGQLEVSIVLIICEILKWVNIPSKKGFLGRNT